MDTEEGMFMAGEINIDLHLDDSPEEVDEIRNVLDDPLPQQPNDTCKASDSQSNASTPVALEEPDDPQPSFTTAKVASEADAAIDSDESYIDENEDELNFQELNSAAGHDTDALGISVPTEEHRLYHDDELSLLDPHERLDYNEELGSAVQDEEVDTDRGVAHESSAIEVLPSVSQRTQSDTTGIALRMRRRQSPPAQSRAPKDCSRYSRSKDLNHQQPLFTVDLRNPSKPFRINNYDSKACSDTQQRFGFGHLPLLDPNGPRFDGRAAFTVPVCHQGQQGTAPFGDSYARGEAMPQPIAEPTVGFGTGVQHMASHRGSRAGPRDFQPRSAFVRQPSRHPQPAMFRPPLHPVPKRNNPILPLPDRRPDTMSVCRPIAVAPPGLMSSAAPSSLPVPEQTFKIPDYHAWRRVVAMPPPPRRGMSRMGILSGRQTPAQFAANLTKRKYDLPHRRLLSGQQMMETCMHQQATPAMPLTQPRLAGGQLAAPSTYVNVGFGGNAYRQHNDSYASQGSYCQHEPIPNLESSNLRLPGPPHETVFRQPLTATTHARILPPSHKLQPAFAGRRPEGPSVIDDSYAESYYAEEQRRKRIREDISIERSAKRRIDLQCNQQPSMVGGGSGKQRAVALVDEAVARPNAAASAAHHVQREEVATQREAWRQLQAQQPRASDHHMDVYDGQYANLSSADPGPERYYEDDMAMPVMNPYTSQSATRGMSFTSPTVVSQGVAYDATSKAPIQCSKVVPRMLGMNRASRQHDGGVDLGQQRLAGLPFPGAKRTVPSTSQAFSSAHTASASPQFVPSVLAAAHMPTFSATRSSTPPNDDDDEIQIIQEKIVSPGRRYAQRLPAPPSRRSTFRVEASLPPGYDAIAIKQHAMQFGEVLGAVEVRDSGDGDGWSIYTVRFADRVAAEQFRSTIDAMNP